MTTPVFSHSDLPSAAVQTGSISIATYRFLVDQCARRKLNFVIANGSAVHARILITKLFEIAESEVVIVSGRLTDTSESGHEVYAYEPVINAAKQFLINPNAQLSIVLQEGEMQLGNGNRFFRAVVNDENRRGVVTITTPKQKTLGSEIPHFMVTDRSAYRLETGTDAMNKAPDRMTAVANFGDLATADDLRIYFDEVIDFVSSGNFQTAQSYGPGVRI